MTLRDRKLREDCHSVLSIQRVAEALQIKMVWAVEKFSLNNTTPSGWFIELRVIKNIKKSH